MSSRIDLGLEVVKGRISLLENRLSSSNETNVCSDRQYCLYALLLVGEYANIHFLTQNPPNDDGDLFVYRQKAWDLLEGALPRLELVSPNDEVRLMLCYEYSSFLWLYCHSQEEARSYAQQTYEAACSLDVKLTPNQTEILEKIREDLLLGGGPAPLFAPAKSKSAESTLEQTFARIHGVNGAGNEAQHHRKKTVKFADIDQLRELKALGTGPGGRFMGVTMLLKRSLAQCHEMVLIEGIPSGSIILKALDKIFRAYVRGNALAGQQTSGNTVELAGHTLSFGAFVLNGPYLSWRGFVQFLQDFSVATFPSARSKDGKKFWQAMAAHNIVASSEADVAQRSAQPLVTLKEAALLFVQASCTVFPLLGSRKVTHLSVLRPKEDDPNGPSDEHIEAECWREVFTRAGNESSTEWEIETGTNFSQFIDLVGKLGLAGYSSGHFSEILPTPEDKVQHFLSAYLGLADTRKWMTRVQRRLQNSTKDIKGAADRARSPTERKAATSS